MLNISMVFLFYLFTEECQALGHEGHMPLMDELRGWHMNPFRYTNEIRISVTKLFLLPPTLANLLLSMLVS